MIKSLKKLGVNNDIEGQTIGGTHDLFDDTLLIVSVL